MVLTRSKTLSRTYPRRSARLSGIQPSLPSIHLPDDRRLSRSHRKIGRGAKLGQRGLANHPPSPVPDGEASGSHQHPTLGRKSLKREKTRSDNQEVDLQPHHKTTCNPEAQAILAHLEEHYQCPLCLDIVANPHTLSSANCGHTFCAMCILKWFFAKLHRSCGTWHESVKCPLCRSLLILTPEIIPRQIITVPFAPNRLAEGAMKSMIERLAVLLPSPKEERKRKRTKARTYVRSCAKNGLCKSEGSEPMIKAKTPSDEDGDGCSGLKGWASRGNLRKDWTERVKLGQTEMDRVISSWSMLRPNDFIKLKFHLGV